MPGHGALICARAPTKIYVQTGARVGVGPNSFDFRLAFLIFCYVRQAFSKFVIGSSNVQNFTAVNLA